MVQKSVVERFMDMKQLSEGGIIGSILNEPDLLTEANFSKHRDKFAEETKLYYGIFEGMYKQGYQTFDEISIFAYINNDQTVLDKYNARGGYAVLNELKGIIDPDNFSTYTDTFNKVCLLGELKQKGFDIVSNFDKFEKMTSAQVFDWFEYQLNSVSADIGSDVQFESLEITDEDIDELLSGAQMGIPYSDHSPLLSYMTLGLPKGDLSIIGAYVNEGKSSFTSANIVFPLASRGVKVGVLANEMSKNAYQQLLLQYVLTYEMHVYDITRKKVKMGKFADRRETIAKAQKIIKEKYAPNIVFGKTFDYDLTRTRKILKRWSKIGVEVAIYDTLKADTTDSSSWENLINSTRMLYQLASKEDMAIVAIMQLALATKVRRILDLDVLAGGKQSSEVASEMIFFRGLHPDEKVGEINEVRCYNFERDSNGKYTGDRKYLELDNDKEYRIMFLVKSRNDRTGQAVIYEFRGHNNTWVELGYCQVKAD